MLTTGIKACEQFLHDTLLKLPGVARVRSSIVLEEVKAEVALPIGGKEAAATAAGKGGGRRR